MCDLFKTEVPHAECLLCDSKIPYFSENIGGKVSSLIWSDIVIHVPYLWVCIINRIQLILNTGLFFHYSSYFLAPLLSDFCHFFHFLSHSVLLVHTRVAWKILCFVSSHLYIWEHKLILSYDKQRFIMLPSSASWWAATHWDVVLNSWSPLANPPILLFFPSFLPQMLLLSFFFQVRTRDLAP